MAHRRSWSLSWSLSQPRVLPLMPICLSQPKRSMSRRRLSALHSSWKASLYFWGIYSRRSMRPLTALGAGALEAGLAGLSTGEELAGENLHLTTTAEAAENVLHHFYLDASLPISGFNEVQPVGQLVLHVSVGIDNLESVLHTVASPFARVLAVILEYEGFVVNENGMRGWGCNRRIRTPTRDALPGWGMTWVSCSCGCRIPPRTGIAWASNR